MEANDDSQAPTAGRYLRPDSSASSRSRYTQQSSNGSSIHVPHRGHTSSRDIEKVRDRGQMERRGPSGASLLQERLKEKKAARLGERRRSTDSNVPLESSGVSSSPKLGTSSGSGKDRDGRPGSSGDRGGAKKGMGVKEMEATASTLHKENWALKLTVQFHQQRQSDLEERLEAAEARANAQADAQAELQSVNEDLLAELERRDQALEESMGIICDLEEDIERLRRELGARMSPDFQSDSAVRNRSNSASGSRSPDPVSSSPQRDDAGISALAGTIRRKRTPGFVTRMPSFLSDQSEGAEALRSLYLPADQEGQCKPSLPKLSEENGTEYEHTEGMDSPRLSVLSESSFLSVYGDKALGLDGLEDGEQIGSPDYRGHRKSTSIEKWVDERAKATNSAPKRPSAPKATNLRIGQFNSINDIIESPLQRLEKLNQSNKHPSLPLHHSSHLISVSGDRGSLGQSKQRDNLRRTEMISFEYESGLPPTPDTISTSTLRMHEKTGDNTGTESIERDHERRQANVDARIANSSFNNLLGARPHSAGETITSRREGHGWDTVTQSEVTASDGDASAPNTFDPWIAMGKERHRSVIQPPDMFTFGGDDDDDWEGDSSNLDAGSYLPPLKRHERNPARARDPRSEDTVVGPSRLRRSYSTDSSPRFPPRGPPLSQQVSPNPPERSSSLAAASPSEKKTRRPRQPELLLSLPPVQPGLRAAALPANQGQMNSKRSRVVRLFSLGRSEQQVNAAPPPLPPIVTQSRPSDRSQSFTHTSRRRRNSIDLDQVAKDMQKASGATPPPIARYPKSQGGDGNREAPTVRPLSVASLESNLRERSTRPRGYDDGFGVDGAGDAREDLELGALGSANIGGHSKRENKDSKPQGRKWFGLGRAGSLMR